MSGLIWEAAGPDDVLSRAVDSARKVRPAGIAEALEETRGDYGPRAHRSLVLASACADSDLAEKWLSEQPGNPDARLLYARVAVTRAIREAEKKKSRHFTKLAGFAQRACFTAVREADPADPTPWSAALALARFTPAWAGVGLGGHHVSCFEPIAQAIRGIPGPWRLLSEVRSRDENHREAHHWVLYTLSPRFGGSTEGLYAFARQVQEGRPDDSDPQVLPLVAFAESHRHAHGATGLGELLWKNEDVQRVALKLYERGWFDRVRQLRFPPIQDLSYLAHALYMGGHFIQARAVFEAMGPYAAAMPWSLHGDAREQVRRARAQCGIPVTESSIAWRSPSSPEPVDFHRAGRDVLLQRALDAASVDRPTGIAEAMAETRGEFELRAHRSLLLGQACARNDLAERWTATEPGNPDALLLCARTAVARALRAAADRDVRWTGLARTALRACQNAVTAEPDDPTPRAAILALARLGHTPHAVSLGMCTPQAGPARATDVFGPWPYLRAVTNLDPAHREAHENFLQCLSPRHGGTHEQMWVFANYLYAETAPDSDLKLLTLSLIVEQYRDLRRLREPADGLWTELSTMTLLEDLYERGWFKHARQRRFPPITDLSNLAFGLFISHHYAEARDVLAAIAPYADPMPWQLLGAPEAWVRRARSRTGGWTPLPPPRPDP